MLQESRSPCFAAALSGPAVEESVLHRGQSAVHVTGTSRWQFVIMFCMLYCDSQGAHLEKTPGRMPCEAA